MAVTNDYTGFPTNGVVSTNGVLTVQNPPMVSIAYLRSLQDPLNAYAPTVPLTQPFEVVGTVTTYTNLTTGNTSSYYLQDGTAGINIFATGGSTFRPAQGDVVDYVGVLSAYATGFELYADTADNSVPLYLLHGHRQHGPVADADKHSHELRQRLRPALCEHEHRRLAGAAFRRLFRRQGGNAHSTPAPTM